jgi:hypothetical protein
MTNNHLDVWARRAMIIPTLAELDVWDAFDHRDAIRQAGETDLPEHDAAILGAADDQWHEAAARVRPLLQLGSYLSSRPADHYARTYLEETS